MPAFGMYRLQVSICSSGRRPSVLLIVQLRSKVRARPHSRWSVGLTVLADSEYHLVLVLVYISRTTKPDHWHIKYDI